MISEATSILAIAGGVCIALLQSKGSPATPRRLLTLLVTVCLFNLAVLAISAIFRMGDNIVHALPGHLMLPLVAIAAGLWLGASFAEIWRRPFHAFPRLLFLLVLCFFGLSNTWTGYFGPSYIDPQVHPDTIIRFKVIHQWVMPFLIGSMLLFWLRRLTANRSAAPNELST